jgi:hypothetical protein
MRDEDPDDLGEAELPLDPQVTPELFLEWRSPRRGKSNPERMNNSVWNWLIRSRVTAYRAGELLSGPSPSDTGPGWCFHRFGQTSTQLPDGRVVFISGEHEDYYDSDFYIYNDVVVQYPDGHLDIYGYPPAVFPPTDFHSATLVGNRILLIGSLSYTENRRPGFTQVLSLSLEDFSISKVETFGASPGWIHEHTATLSDRGDSIVIRQGMVQQDGKRIENIDDWELSLLYFRWHCLVKRHWSRWDVRRSDGKPNHLWKMRSLRWAQGWQGSDEFLADTAKLAEELGTPPDLDAFDCLYRPSIPHEAITADDDKFDVFRVRIEGVVIRYVEGIHGIRMTVEGDLPLDTIKPLVAELRDRLASLENSPCEFKEL